MSKAFWSVHAGDCLETMRGMADNSVDSVVCDPPYGLSFMGKKWDYDVPSTEIWAECLRVLKPGGYLLAFAGTRTQHRMAVRIEDAGFEIRDMLAWMYGSGFPKSHNGEWGGTGLKPAIEPITMARKPLTGTVAANFSEHGTGGLNIDGCRVGPTGESRPRQGEVSQEYRYTENGGTNFSAKLGIRGGDPAGRWPANLIHDGSDEVVALFPESASGAMRASSRRAAQDEPGSVCYGVLGGSISSIDRKATTGSAARFFYCAKASRKDRHSGMESPGPQFKSGTTLRNVENTATTGNNHPTVKLTDLMAYLCRLVTPPGGVVFDPFMGGGSTGKAAALEGFSFIGCELSAEYVEIAIARISQAAGVAARPAGRPTVTPVMRDLFDEVTA